RCLVPCSSRASTSALPARTRGTGEPSPLSRAGTAGAPARRRAAAAVPCQSKWMERLRPGCRRPGYSTKASTRSGRPASARRGGTGGAFALGVWLAVGQFQLPDQGGDGGPGVRADLAQGDGGGGAVLGFVQQRRQGGDCRSGVLAQRLQRLQRLHHLEPVGI